jgi:hypothetical protein
LSSAAASGYICRLLHSHGGRGDHAHVFGWPANSKIQTI